MEVTYVVNPSLFYVRKMVTKSEFLQLEEDLTAYGNNLEKQHLETSLNIEQSTIARNDIINAFLPHLSCFTDNMCIVKQRRVNEWYRGLVREIYTTDDGKTSYSVVYIDYGYEEYNIAASRVQEIAERLRTLPPQAIRCCLHGIVPKNFYWTNASTNDFLKLTNGA